MRLKLHKRSEWKFVSRIIPHKQVFNTPQRAFESVSKACFGVHTLDSTRKNLGIIWIRPFSSVILSAGLFLATVAVPIYAWHRERADRLHNHRAKTVAEFLLSSYAR